MAGRKPKPTNLHILNGNPSRLDLKNKSKTEPKPQKDLIPCPDYLKDNEVAYEEWNRIVPELYRLGLLTLVDRAALELYCSQYAIYRDALEEIKNEGITTTNIRSGAKAHPATQVAREAAKIIKSIATEFGLTPSSRSRISLPGEDLDKEYEDLIEQ